MLNRSPHPTPGAGTRMRLGRVTAVAAAIALLTGIGAMGSAHAVETQPEQVATWVTRPVDPQPVVPGHEGDVLLQVNVVMAANTTVPAALRPKASKAAKAAKPASARPRR